MPRKCSACGYSAGRKDRVSLHIKTMAMSKDPKYAEAAKEHADAKPLLAEKTAAPAKEDCKASQPEVPKEEVKKEEVGGEVQEVSADAATGDPGMEASDAAALNILFSDALEVEGPAEAAGAAAMEAKFGRLSPHEAEVLSRLGTVEAALRAGGKPARTQENPAQQAQQVGGVHCGEAAMGGPR